MNVYVEGTHSGKKKRQQWNNLVIFPVNVVSIVSGLR